MLNQSINTCKKVDVKEQGLRNTTRTNVLRREVYVTFDLERTGCWV